MNVDSWQILVGGLAMAGSIVGALAIRYLANIDRKIEAAEALTSRVVRVEGVLEHVQNRVLVLEALINNQLRELDNKVDDIRLRMAGDTRAEQIFESIRGMIGNRMSEAQKRDREKPA